MGVCGMGRVSLEATIAKSSKYNTGLKTKAQKSRGKNRK